MAEVDIAAMLGAMAADLRDMRRENKAEHEELNRQIASLRHAVTQYHSVLGSKRTQPAVSAKPLINAI
ncbi:MAG: hypothetical protein HQL41_17820 [Alphaproteobacteria bacterium]|nr:hypothetical protein [Alphaproteobacteria bacterium]